MAQTISRQAHTAEAGVRSRFSPRKICGGQSGTWKGSNPPPTRVLRFATVNVIPPMTDTHLHLLIPAALSRRSNGKSLRPCKNASSGNRGTLGSKVITLFLVFKWLNELDSYTNFKLWLSAKYFNKNSTTVQPSILVHNHLSSELHNSTVHYIYMLNVTDA